MSDLYDKHGSFPFQTPNLSSNAPCKVFYTTFGAEILRIGRTTTNLNNFKLSL